MLLRPPTNPCRSLAAAIALAVAGGGASACTLHNDSIDPLVSTSPTTSFVVGPDGKPVLIVRAGRLEGLEGQVVELPAGPTTFAVQHHGEPIPSPPPEGTEVSETAITLWLRGHGQARAWLPQSTTGLVNPEVTQDWAVDLPAGDYSLSLSLNGKGGRPTTLRVR